MTGNDSSRRLLENYRDGESKAAAEVFDRYVARLLALVRGRISSKLQRRVDAEDIVQSALRSFFIRARDERYILQRSGDLWRLLAAIALSKLRRQVEVHTAAKRAVEAEQVVVDGDAQAAIDREPSPDAQLALLDELNHVVSTINTAQREALNLRLAGESIEDIAASMGRSQRTVRRLLQTTRLLLEQRLSAIDEG